MIMKKIYLILKILIIVLVVSSCLNEPEQVEDISENPIENIVIPENFDFSTTKQIELSLAVPEYLSNAVFTVVAQSRDYGNMEIGTATFNEDGIFSSLYDVPTYIDTLVINSGYIGFIDGIIIPIEVNSATFDYRPLYEETSTKSAAASTFTSSLKSAGISAYNYLGDYNSTGVPDYLVASDQIEQNLLDDVNASLPEYKKVPEVNPEFIASSTETNLVITKKADVWVTFVSEGAGYRNALGYYSYEKGKAPASVDEIENLTIVLPNVSFSGSGGGLTSGNKVYLGQFDANTVVAWFLVADGWNGSDVGDGRGIYFSDPELNPESNPSNRNHMVMLWDKGREQVLMGFEDINREQSGCDQDFNDAIFYASSNPVDAIERTNVQEIVAANDSDGDGINDEIDDFPYDPNRAFNNFSPSARDFGTLAYEDLWPSKGDYDFNDVVVDYRFNKVANYINKIQSIEATFYVKHIGGSFKNGLAFIIPVSSSNIKSVENQVMNAGYANLKSNGTESGVSETVIFVSENISALKGDTLKIVVNFNSPVSSSSLGSAPFNPFIIVDGERSREVHLPDMKPTSKGTVYLGQNDDYSSVEDGRYYKTDRNLPWALNFYSSFSPPAERQSIDKAYPKFGSWANSGGTKNLDWYR